MWRLRRDKLSLTELGSGLASEIVVGFEFLTLANKTKTR